MDCAGDTSGHLRRFNLTTEGVTRDYLITGIDVGINSTTGANITVNIYLDNTIDNAITTYTVPISNTVTPYATAVSAVPAGAGFVHTVPFDVFLPAGTAFTVEVISPSSQDFMIGYYDSGVTNVPDSTATAYTSCTGGLAYSDLIAFNLGGNALLIQVQGTESDSLTTTQTAGLPPGETYPLGTTVNTFETTDGVSTESCSFNVNVLGNTLTTYTGGAWDNGTPTTNAVAVFSDAYDTSDPGNSSIDACLCEINSGGDLTVAAGDYLNVQTDVLVNSGGNLTVEHTGSVVQTNDLGVATNNGTVNVNLTTPNLASRDFMVLGSPMSGETRESVWSSAFLVIGATTANFVPHPDVAIQFPGAENFADDNGDFWNPHSGALVPGTGYIVRPQAGYGQPGGVFNYTYDGGTLNTGDVSFTVVQNTPGPTPADNKNASPNVLSNPYPSAISADDLINANAMIDEVYFWEHLTPPSTTLPGANNMNFSMEDISMYNLSGGTAAASDPGTSTEPNGIISTGQGFGIKASAAGTATFTNAMRRTSGNTTLRLQDDLERIWLQVTNQEHGMQKQALIAFNPVATEGMDPGYDSRRLATVVSLYSHLNDGTQELGIQTREAFDEAITIPMGFSTLLDESLQYKVSISNIEGAQLSEVDVYLVDHLTGAVQDLRADSYSFTSEMGTFNNRFTLHFGRVLGTEDVLLDRIALLPNPTTGELNIISPEVSLQKVEIHDLMGRLVSTVEGNNATSLKLDLSSLQNSIYFVTLTTDQGILTKRVIKK